MKNFLLRILVNGILFLLLAGIFPKIFYINGIIIAFVSAFVLVLLNGFIKPILTVLTLPINIITFGLFSFILSAFILELVSIIMGKNNFYFINFGAAILISLIMTLCNTVILNLFSN